jgi:GNAT superfamily N-acetyltransferase
VTSKTLPLTLANFEDLVTVINPTRNPRSCWCLAYRLTSAEIASFDAGGEGAMRDLAAGERPPGLIAYRDGEPVGWVGTALRSEVRRLAHSRVIPHVDDLPVWSVFCLVVRPGFRGRGVTGQLIEGAVAYAAAQGAPYAEAYPVEKPQGKVNSALAYVGTTAMFEKAGFDKVVRTSSTSDGLVRWLMRRTLSGGR